MNNKDTSQEYLQILSKLSGDLISKDSLDEVVWSITENCISDLGFEDCVIYLLDPKDEFLIQKAAFGPKKWDNFKVNKPIKIPVGQGIVGSVAEHGGYELIPDCSIDPRYIADDAKRLSEIAVPILHHQKVIGVIDSENSKKDFYTNEHLAVLTAIANLASIRIMQIRNTKSLRSHRDELAQQVATKKNELQNALAQVEITNRYLESMVTEKDELLKQFHHNVKNQIQMMQSLINLQSEDTQNEEVKVHLKSCGNRIRCMALAHQMANGLSIDISMYLRHLNDELGIAYNQQPIAPLLVTTSRVELATDKAVLLGFILTDLFVAGSDKVSEVAEPSSVIRLNITDQCEMHYESNWWGFDKIDGITALFIAQIGAQKKDCDSGLLMVCK